MEKLGISLEINSSGMAKGISDLDKLGKAGDKAETSISGLSTAFKAAAVAGASFAAIATANSMLKTAAATESLIGQLKVATGSMENAVKAFGELNKLNTLMPESVEGITSAFIKMKNLGLEPTAQALMSFSNTAAASGKQIMDFVEAVADATTGEFERLKEFGIKTSKEGEKVAFTFQGVTTSIKNDATAINQYLENIGNTTFAGSAAAQMETLSGAVSNVSASYDNMLLSINAATGSSETAKGVLVSVTTVMDSLTSAISAAYGESEKMKGGFDGLIVIGKSVASTVQAISATFEGLSTAVGFVGAAIASFGDSTITISGLWDEYNKQIGEITAKTIIFNEVLYSEQKPVSLQEVAKTLDPIAKRTQAAATATDAYALSSKELEKEQKRAAKAIEDAKNAIEKQMSAINAAQVAMRKFTNGSDFERMNSDIEELNQSWKVLYDAGLTSAQEYADALYQIDSDRLGFSIDTNDKIKKNTTETVDLTVKAMENSFRRLDDTFANIWEDIFNGAADFGSSLKRWFNSLLAELAHAALTKPIVLSITGALGLGGATTALASGGVGGLDSIINMGSSLAAMASAFSQGAAYGLGALGTSSFGAANSTISSMIGTGNYAGAAGAAAGTYLPVIGGAIYGYQKSGLQGALGGAGGAYAGAQLGTMVLPGIGTAVGAALGAIGGEALMTGIFGGSWRTYAADANVNVNTGGANYQSTTYQNRDPGWGRRTQWRQSSAQNFQAANDIGNFMRVLSSTVRDGAQELGFSFNENFSASFNTSLMGKSGDQVKNEINNWLNGVAEGLVYSSGGLGNYLDSMRNSGEMLYQTLGRVIDQFHLYNAPLNQVNDSLSVLNQSTVVAIDQFIKLAGSIDNIRTLESKFVDLFYSDVEKIALLEGTVKNLFNTINKAIPSTRDGFVDLVRNLDLTDSANQKVYVALLNNVELLDQYYDVVSTFNDAINQTIASQQQAIAQLYAAFQDDSFGLQVRLLELAGRSQDALNLQREKELIAMDESLHAIQRNVWALEDQATATEKVKTAVSSAFTAFNTFSKSIKTFIAGLMIGTSVSAASVYASDLTAARGGNQDALSGITDSAQKYLDEAKKSASSQVDYMRVQAKVISDLSALPEVISPLKQLSDDIKNTIINDLPKSIEAAILSTQLTINGLVSLTSDTSKLSPKLKEMVTFGAATLQSTINLLAGSDKLTDTQKKLALTPLNTLTSTINLIAGSDNLSNTAKQLALTPLNTLNSTVNLLLGSDKLTWAQKELALKASDNLTRTVGFIAGSQVSDDLKELALKAPDTLTRTIDALIKEGTSEDVLALALNESNKLESSVTAILNSNSNTEAKKLALGNLNHYTSSVTAILNSNSDVDAKKLALANENAYTTTVNAVLLAGLNEDAKALALKSANSLKTTVNAVLDSNASTDAKKLALNASNSLSASVTAILSSNSDANAKKLALGTLNNYTSSVTAILSSNSSSDAKALALDTARKNIERNITATGGTLNAAQKALLDAINGKTDVSLTATVSNNTDLESSLDNISGNTKDIASEAEKQLAALKAVNDSTAKQVSGQITLNNTMLSLKDAIYALGVTQAEQLRIEQDRIAKEKAEAERVAKIAEITKQGESVAGSYNWYKSTIAQGINDIGALASKYNVRLENAGGGAANFTLTDSKFTSDYDQIDYSNASQATAFKNEFWQSGGVHDRTYGYADELSSTYSRLNTLREQVKALGGIPQFAVGTNYIPQDMIAQVHKGEMIVPAKYNPMTSGIGGDNAAMIAELQALRAELAELKAQDRQIGVQLIKATNKTADQLEQWDETGIKTEVIA